MFKDALALDDHILAIRQRRSPESVRAAHAVVAIAFTSEFSTDEPFFILACCLHSIDVRMLNVAG
jgi:hypothetical protein